MVWAEGEGVPGRLCRKIEPGRDHIRGAPWSWRTASLGPQGIPKSEAPFPKTFCTPNRRRAFVTGSLPENFQTMRSSRATQIYTGQWLGVHRHGEGTLLRQAAWKPASVH